VSRIHPIIMAGGRGTRFWPASRHDRPKQFLAVAGEESLLTRTGRRVFPLSSPNDAWVVTNVQHVGMAADHLPEIPHDQIVGEPVGRNTAPCIALAAALVEREDPEGVLVVTPADHWIGDEEGFRAVMLRGVEVARERRGLVTFGIVPSAPETGYGYIEAGDPLDAAEESARRVARFTEKPDRATAEQFLAGGRHFWNSGIFAWRADVFLEELSHHHPDMASECRRMAESVDRESALQAGYAALTSISVDYAVLEPSDNVYMVPATFAWSDVGSWDAAAELEDSDPAGNLLLGEVLAQDCHRVYADGQAGRLLALIGVEDLVVVDTDDATLIVKRGRSQEVRSLVDQLKASDPEKT